MSEWRSRALKAFPEFRSVIQRVDSQSALWVELFPNFVAQYDPDRILADDPSNLVRRIYLYAIWCSGARDWRTREAVEIGFFESLGFSAMSSKKAAYDQIIEDAVAHLGFPGLKAHAQGLGHLITKEKLEKFLRDAEQVANRNQKRSAKSRH